MKVLKRINEIKAATYNKSINEIIFDAIGKSIRVDECDPFYYNKNSGKYEDRVTLSFYGDLVAYSKPANKELVKEYEESGEGTASYNQRYIQIMKENREKIGAELFKVADDFDKKFIKAVEDVMKKYGFSKEKN